MAIGGPIWSGCRVTIGHPRHERLSPKVMVHCSECVRRGLMIRKDIAGVATPTYPDVEHGTNRQRRIANGSSTICP
jgi:hypothetical protein